MQVIQNKQKLNPYMENVGKITNILCLKNGNILSISDKGEIRIFADQTYTILSFFNDKDQHNYKCICQINTGEIFIGDSQGNIFIFGINNNNSIERINEMIEEHYSCVSKIIQLSNTKILSCSYDKTIHLYDNLKPFTTLNYLTMGHKNQIKSILELNNNKFFVSIGEDGYLTFWNIEKKYEIDKRIDLGLNKMNSEGLIQIDNERLAIINHSVISIFNITASILEFNLSEHLNQISCLLFFGNNYFYSLSEDKFIEWDVKKLTMKRFIDNNNIVNNMTFSREGEIIGVKGINIVKIS